MLSMFPWHIDAHYLYSTNYHYCRSAGIATTNSTDWVANCPNVKADDGRFMAEHGFVVVVCFAKKKVCVGSLEWVKRLGVTKNPFLEIKELVMKVGIDGVLAGLHYVKDERSEDVTGVHTLTSQGINVYLFNKDQTGSVEYVVSILGISKKPMFYVVKEAVSLTNSGESIRTSWITYISTDSMLISLLYMMICWSRWLVMCSRYYSYNVGLNHQFLPLLWEDSMVLVACWMLGYNCNFDMRLIDIKFNMGKVFVGKSYIGINYMLRDRLIMGICMCMKCYCHYIHVWTHLKKLLNWQYAFLRNRVWKHTKNHAGNSKDFDLYCTNEILMI
ncbi:putative translocase [Helianthus anomalus]